MLSDSEPLPAEIQAGLNGVVRDMLRPAAAMLAAAHVCLAIADASELPADSRGRMLLLDGAAAMAGAGLWMYFSRVLVTPEQANRWAALMLALALANFACHVSLAPSPSIAVFLVLFVVAAGCFLLSWGYMTAAVLSSAAVWTLGMFLDPAGEWGRFVPVFLMGVILGLLVHGQRWRSYRRYEEEIIAASLRRKAAEEEISDLNRQLEQASRLVSLGEMAANLAHDLGNGLSSVLQFTQGAVHRSKRGTLTLEQSGRCIHDIQEQAQHMRKVLLMMQQFVRTRTTRRVPVHLPEIIQQSGLLVEAKLRQNEIELRLAEPPEIPSLLADPAQISIVLVNLLLNAAQAMARTEPEKRCITVAVQNDRPDLVEVSVQDQGPGVPAELREKIFEKFYTTKKDGLGLGLAFSRSYIEAHGGKLWCHPDVNAGCEFRFTLPLSGTEGQTPAEIESAKAR